MGDISELLDRIYVLAKKLKMDKLEDFELIKSGYMEDVRLRTKCKIEDKKIKLETFANLNYLIALAAFVVASIGFFYSVFTRDGQKVTLDINEFPEVVLFSILVVIVVILISLTLSYIWRKNKLLNEISELKKLILYIDLYMKKVNR